MIDGSIRTFLILLCAAAVLGLLIATNIYRYTQCQKDGYSKTQCLNMVQAQHSINQNVFGLEK